MMHLQNALDRLKRSGTTYQYLVITEVQREVQRLADAYDRVEKTLKETQDAAQQALDVLNWVEAAMEERNNNVAVGKCATSIRSLRDALGKAGYRPVSYGGVPMPPPRKLNGTPDHIAASGKMVTLTASGAQLIEDAFIYHADWTDPNSIIMKEDAAAKALATIRAAIAQKPTDCPCCGAKGTVIPSAFCRECKSDFWPPSVPVKSDRAAKEHKVMEGFDRSKYTPEQWEWCVKYENRTGFDPMMEDFEAGIKTFYEAAQHACAWYDDHTGDAHNAVTRNIPGNPIEG
jgi:hypothetical protein